MKVIYMKEYNGWNGSLKNLSSIEDDASSCQRKHTNNMHVAQIAYSKHKNIKYYECLIWHVKNNKISGGAKKT